MKTSIQIALLFVALIAVATGWWSDRQRQQLQIAKLEEKVIRVSTTAAIVSAACSNQRSAELASRENADSVAAVQHLNLIYFIYYLATHELDVDEYLAATASEDQDAMFQTSEYLGSTMLMALNCDSPADYLQLCKTVDRSGDSMALTEEVSTQLCDFIQRSLKHALSVEVSASETLLQSGGNSTAIKALEDRIAKR